MKKKKVPFKIIAFLPISLSLVNKIVLRKLWYVKCDF